MYLAESRAAKAPAAAPGKSPGRGGAAVPGTVLALGAVSLITDISSEMVTAVLPLYVVTGLGLSPLGFGVLDGINNGVGSLVRLLGGHFADRGGRGHKTVAALGYGLSALCKPLLLLVHSITLIGGVLAVDRTGKGLRTAPRDAMISLATAPEHRGRAFGVHRAMDTTGALLGPLLAFALLRLTVDGYDAVFTVSGCIAVIGVLVLLLFVPTPAAAPRSEEPRTAPPKLTESLALLKLPALRRLTLCAMLLGLTTVSDSFLYLLLQRQLDLPTRMFPLLPLGTAAAFLLLAYPLGVVADRIGRRTLFLLGHAVLLLAYTAVLLSTGSGAAVAVGVLLLHGLFYAATDGVLAAAAADVTPADQVGAGLALVGTGQALARFACSLLFGAAWSVWGGHTTLAVTAAAMTAGAVTAGFVLRTATPTGTAGAAK
ncbi:MFS transporter [Kitasatospora sp. MMS16-BH015]|uniref:MFS transporter n=1 Tax=Kitasatospora sp. MMS16-BH015 TaxID=2018025 RepID=UPI000CA2070E|nr:MFS transporter [Kitasatospora sp. MMS16-BH015]AUG80247.1 MFS transporter [Kitasatospora sp. MMS16-BH015]